MLRRALVLGPGSWVAEEGSKLRTQFGGARCHRVGHPPQPGHRWIRRLKHWTKIYRKIGHQFSNSPKLTTGPQPNPFAPQSCEHLFSTLAWIKQTPSIAAEIRRTNKTNPCQTPRMRSFWRKIKAFCRKIQCCWTSCFFLNPGSDYVAVIFMKC